MDTVMDLKKEYEETLEKVKGLKEGEIVKGIVVQADKKEILVDIGYKAEGVISTTEINRNAKKLSDLKIGDEIDVLLLNKEDEHGRMLLSYSRAYSIVGWKKIMEAFEKSQVMQVTIISEKKTSAGKLAGFTVESENVRGFLPLSAIDIDRIENAKSYSGKIFEMKVIEVDEKTHNVVFSRKVLVDEVRKKQREILFTTLHIGEVREGIVKTLAPFGVFVDLGGIDGLVRLNDLSWGKKRPDELLKTGDKIKVMVLDFNKDEGKISLGVKHLKPDPWNNIEKKYPVGTRIKGKVVKVAAFGVFVEIEEGIDGLVRLEDLTWKRSVKHPSEIVKEGDEMEFVVTLLNKEERRLALGLKHIQEDPWFAACEKYQPGTKVKGKIVKMTTFGAFIRMDDDMDGLIRLKDMSWTKRVKHPSEVFVKGREIEAVVLKVDRENKKIALGMKQLMPSPWDEYKRGTHVHGKIARIEDFGAYVTLEENIEGFVHVSELSEKYINKPDEVVSVGQEFDFKVIKVNPKDKKIELSLKGYTDDKEKQEIRQYISSQEKDVMTLGDIAPHLKNNKK